MPRKKAPEQYAVVDEKKLLHPYELQQLLGTRFVSVANRILTGHLSLIHDRGYRFNRVPLSQLGEHPWDVDTLSDSAGHSTMHPDLSMRDMDADDGGSSYFGAMGA
jgi:hypothetical protein